MLFSIFLQFISSCLQSPSSIAAFRDRVFNGVVWSMLEVYFFPSEIFELFSGKTHVFGRSFIFHTFVCNHGALNLRLNVVAWPTSVTMSWPARITLKLKTSGLDVSVLVWQISNCFDLIFFFNFFHFFPSGCKVRRQFLHLGAMSFTGLFGRG